MAKIKDLEVVMMDAVLAMERVGPRRTAEIERLLGNLEQAALSDLDLESSEELDDMPADRSLGATSGEAIDRLRHYIDTLPK